MLRHLPLDLHGIRIRYQIFTPQECCWCYFISPAHYIQGTVQYLTLTLSRKLTKSRTFFDASQSISDGPGKIGWMLIWPAGQVFMIHIQCQNEFVWVYLVSV